MKARYTQPFKKSCPKGCDVKGNWHIEIVRSGGKSNFIICSNCGNLITEVN